MNIHSEKTLRFAYCCFSPVFAQAVPLHLPESWWKTQALQELMWKRLQVCRGGFFLPLITFADFAIERVERDAQRTCSAGDFFLSHISEFSPPPKLQHMNSPTPSCHVSAEVHPAFRNQVGNRSLDHFCNSEKCVVLSGLAGEYLTSRKSFEWHCSGLKSLIFWAWTMSPRKLNLWKVGSFSYKERN